MAEKKFPNGITSWIETHHEVVEFITLTLEKETDTDNMDMCNHVKLTQGTGGIYELAEKWTDEFELLHEGNEWGDADYFETIEAFLVDKNKQ